MTDRIAKLRVAAEADARDPLAFFALGRALLETGDAGEAVAHLQRALALDGKLSRAYALLGDAQLKLERRDEAVETYRRGVVVADGRGDVLPKNDMLAKLAELGEAAPELRPTGPVEVGEGQVLDARTGRVGSRLPRPPFKNALGNVIFEHVSAESWKEWVAHGTKVINELRLPLHDPQAQKVYDQHLVDFLNLGDKL